MQKNDDISLPVRISLLQGAHELSEYHDSDNMAVKKKKNKIRKDLREAVMLYDTYADRQREHDEMKKQCQEAQSRKHVLIDQFAQFMDTCVYSEQQ